MLRACPPVHCDGSELYLDLHISLSVVKENRGINDQVQTAVSVRFWIADIILAGNNVYIVLLLKSIGKHINVRGEEQMTRTPAISVMFS